MDSTPTYSISTSTSSINEGDTVTTTVTTTNVATGTTLFWSTYSSSMVTGDFDASSSLSGSGTITSDGTFSVSQTLKNDLLTEGNESFFLKFFLDSEKTIEVGNNVAITVLDTSTDPPTYSISTSTSSINEGDTVTTTVTTTNVATGTTLFWSTYSSSMVTGDFDASSSLSGSGTITSDGTFSVSQTLKNDLLTEGNESFFLKFFLDSEKTIEVGNNVAITVLDTSTDPPTYSISTSTSSINEGDTVTTTVTTTNVATGTTLFWSTYSSSMVTGDFDASSSLSGSGTITSDGTFSVSQTLKNDLLTEGNESFFLKFFLDSEKTIEVGNNVAITVLDTSTDTASDTITTESGEYLLIKEAKSFADAITASKTYDGHLAQFETKKEATNVWTEINKLISSLTSSFDSTVASDGGGASYVWLGGTDGDTTSTQSSSTWNWKWSESSIEIAKTRTEWGTGYGGTEPDNSRGTQHRLALGLEDWSRGNPGKYGYAGEWNDVNASNELWFLVEKHKTAFNVTNTSVINKITSTISTDTKTYSGKSNDYKFYNLGKDRYAIKSGENYDEITGVSTLDFTDKDLDLGIDIKGTFDQVTGLNTDSGKMFRLYNAAFARFPDADGLKYWIGNFSSGIDDERAVSSSFLASAEFKELYGENITHETYVQNLYLNVLNRELDQDGYDYWVGNLNNGIEERHEVLLGFSESAENKTLFTEMTGFV